MLNMFNYTAAGQDAHLTIAGKQANAQADRHRTGVDAGMFWNKSLCWAQSACIYTCKWHSSKHTVPILSSLWLTEVQDIFLISSVQNAQCLPFQCSSPCGLELLEKPQTTGYCWAPLQTYWETTATVPQHHVISIHNITPAKKKKLVWEYC